MIFYTLLYFIIVISLLHFYLQTIFHRMTLGKYRKGNNYYKVNMDFIQLFATCVINMGISLYLFVTNDTHQISDIPLSFFFISVGLYNLSFAFLIKINIKRFVKIYSNMEKLRLIKMIYINSVDDKSWWEKSYSIVDNFSDNSRGNSEKELLINLAVFYYLFYVKKSFSKVPLKIIEHRNFSLLVNEIEKLSLDSIFEGLTNNNCFSTVYGKSKFPTFGKLK